MQPVSEEYKESMKSPLRDRGYIRVTFGGVNSIAQNTAFISGDQLEYSDSSKVFNNGLDTYVYATLEQNFTKVDGSMYFYSANSSAQKLERGFIGDSLISENNPYQFVISFPTAVSFDTVIFNFGKNYPLAFTITDNFNNTYTYQNDSGRLFTIEQDFEDVTELTFTITEMINENDRFRLYSMNFGSGYEYQNDMILDSSFESSISPINENLPQMNFSLKLVNENHDFDSENPRSVLNQFNTSTEVNVYYGYQLSDRIEWLQGAKLYVEKWDNDNESATIYARDILQNSDKLYIKGTSTQKSLYDLAVDALTEMGISDYSIDSELALITTTNPIPLVPCKEALQLIANAGRKRLFIKRDGSIKIGDDIYAYIYSSNGTLPYSDIDSIGNNDTKDNYATLETNYTKANGTMYFDTSSSFKNVGYVSEQISNQYCLFSTRVGDIKLSEPVIRNNIVNLPYELNEISESEKPVITITLATGTALGGIRLIFGETYATKYTVRCLYNDEIQEQIFVSSNLKDNTVEFANGYGDKIEIEFVETAEPYNRVRVNYLEVIRKDNIYKFDEVDMMSYPRFNKFETIHKITVPYFSYTNSSTSEKLLEQSVVVTDITEEFVFTWNQAATNLSYSGSSSGYTILSSGAYSVTVRFSSTGTKTFVVTGYKFVVSEQVVEEVINENGKDVIWDNPLINSKSMAEDLLSWIKAYYLLEGYYEFNTRGNPEIDANDNGIQTKYTGNLMSVLITDITLDFDGAFSGSVKTLKKGDMA